MNIYIYPFVFIKFIVFIKVIKSVIKTGVLR